MAQYDIDIRDYLRIIRKKKIVIIVTVLTMGILSFIFGILQQRKIEPLFSSYTKVKIEKTVPMIATGMYGGFGYQDDNIMSQMEVITSYDVMEKVAQRHDINIVPDSISSEEIRKNEEYLGAVSWIKSMVLIEQENFMTNVVQIIATSSDRDFTEQLAQAVAEEYQRYRHNELNRNLDQQMAETDSALKVSKQNFDAAADSLEAFRNLYEVTEPEGEMLKVSAESDELESVEAGLIDQQAEARKIVGILLSSEDINEPTLGGLYAQSQSSVFRSLYSDFTTVQLEIQSLLEEGYKPDHYRVTEETAHAKKLLGMMANELQSTIKTIDTRLTEVRNQIKTLREKFKKLTEYNTQYQTLQSDLARNMTTYEYYLQQANETALLNSKRIEEVTIIEPAYLNTVNITPGSRLAASTIIGIIIGLIIAVVFAFISESLDTSIGTIEDVEEYIGVSVVGLIPHIAIEEILDKLVEEKNIDINEIKSKEIERNYRLAIYFAPRSTLAESYRALRTNIQFISLEHEVKTITFTSSLPGEGKTTTVVNLAFTIAQSGKKVLLVDADMRKPTIWRIFGIKKERGLSEILLGNQEWHDCIRTVTDIVTGEMGLSDIMLTPGIDNLHIIPCGTIPTNPSELLNSARADEFIRSASSEYDVVLFDSAPVLPVTDATVLGRKTDGVVLTYAVGKVSRGSLKRAKTQLDHVKANVLGVVLNGLRAETSPDFQDYKYDKYYGYGADAKEPEGRLSNLKGRILDVAEMVKTKIKG